MSNRKSNASFGKDILLVVGGIAIGVVSMIVKGKVSSNGKLMDNLDGDFWSEYEDSEGETEDDEATEDSED